MPRGLGLFDTSAFLHSLYDNPWRASAEALLRDIAAGGTHVEIDPLVVHELTYAYVRHRPGATRSEVVVVIDELLSWRGVMEPKDVIRMALARWESDLALSFVDAYLGVRSELENLPVYTVNRKDFLRQGVDAPDLRELMGTGR